MGFFWKGRLVLTPTVLKHLLKDKEPIPIWQNKEKANYEVKNLSEFISPEDFPNKYREWINRVWLFINLENGSCIAVGDEGNQWCVELVKGDSVQTVLNKLISFNPSSRKMELLFIKKALTL